MPTSNGGTSMNLLRMSGRVLLVIAALAPAIVGCSSSPDKEAEGATGAISMSLVGQTGANTYRLRNARFDVTGPSTTSLDSEVDPNATSLNATLPTGSYSIQLETGWALERLDGMTFNPVDATLISANPTSFQIVANSTSNVKYLFSTNGTIVTI